MGSSQITWSYKDGRHGALNEELDGAVSVHPVQPSRTEEAGEAGGPQTSASGTESELLPLTLTGRVSRWDPYWLEASHW